MTKKYMEQRINLKFCVKLGKTYKEAHDMLKMAYGSNAMSKTQVFAWHRKFTEDFYDGIDIEHNNQSSTTTNAEGTDTLEVACNSKSDSPNKSPAEKNKLKKQAKKKTDTSETVIKLNPSAKPPVGSIAELITHLVNKQIAKNKPVDRIKEENPL